MKRRAARGFTLLEMLVALLVFAALVSLVYGMVRVGSRSWESGSGRIEDAEAMRIASTFLYRALSNARMVPSRQPEGLGVHFSGAPHALEFVADMPAYLGEGGLYVLQLGLDTDTDLRNPPLVLERIPLSEYDPENMPEDPDARQQAILAERVSELAFEYYGRKAEDEVPLWHADWTGEGALPILVRMRVTLPSEDRWPEFVAHLRLGADRQEEMTPEFDPEAGDVPGATEAPPRED